MNSSFCHPGGFLIALVINLERKKLKALENTGFVLNSSIPQLLKNWNASPDLNLNL